MNSIKLFNNADSAIDYLIPAAYPPLVRSYLKTSITSALSEKDIIEKANKILISDNINIYTDFFLKILYMSNEKALIIDTDSSLLSMYILGNIFHNNKYPFDPSQASDRFLWLYIDGLKNEKLFSFIKHYYTTATRYIGTDSSSVYIQLLPAIDTKALDQLARAISAYY